MVELVYQEDNRFAQLLRIAEMILSTYSGPYCPFSSRIAVSVTLSAVMAAPTKSSLPGQSMIFSFLPFHSTWKTVENTE